MKREATLADQQWRLTLSRKTDAQLACDLLEAISAGNMWRFDFLIRMEIRGLDHDALLTKAAEHGRVEIFQHLAGVRKGWREDIYDYAETAAISGQLEILRLLVEKHRLKAEDRNTLMAEAAAHNQLAVIDYLLSKKVSPAVNDGYAIMQAVWNDHPEAVKKLFDADPAQTSKYAEQAMTQAIDAGSDKVILFLMENDADFFGRGEKVLEAASTQGRDDLVKKLLKKGIRATAGDNAAVIGALENGHFAVARLLIDAGADIDAGDGKALYEAIQREDTDCIRFILDNKGDPNRIRNGESMLASALYAEDKTAIDLLLAAGANPEKNKYDAVHMAVREQDSGILKKFAHAARRIRAEERSEKQKELKSLFPGGYSLNDLRTKKGPSGQSGLLIAAQTGKFAEILQAAEGGVQPRLLPSDLYHPDEGIDTVLSMLMRHKSVQQFFDTGLWLDRLEEARRARGMLPERMQKSVSLEGIESAMKLKRAEGRIKNAVPKKPGRGRG